ncbi:MAG: MotA/TolQ/ExbB proton channel family protein [Deltaproteobacteria bacterium]|jgi:biopolymer transport protein ExbB
MSLATMTALLLLTQPSGTTDKPAPATISIDAAYKKEFAFLAGQKRELEKRMAESKQRAEREQREAADAIAKLEAQLLGQEERLRAAHDAALEAETSAQSTVDEGTIVSATLEQSSTTLLDYAVTAEVEKGAPDAAKLDANFGAAVDLLDRLSSVQRARDSFFLADGTKVEGSIVRLGRIAAYGVSDRGAGVLAPAGAGKLKIWQNQGEAAARAVAGGERPAALPLFLFESLDGEVSEDEGQTIYEHVDSGGAIAWVIVGLGAFGLLLVLLRGLLLLRSGAASQSVEERVGGLVDEGRLEEATAFAKATAGSAARVAHGVLAGLQRGTKRLDELVEEHLLAENRRINRFATVILVIAAVSPLLGLLGTVTGMISTFDVITKFGTGDPKMLSGGISTALVTTELGLIVAIPTLLLGNLLKGWGERIEGEVERVALSIVNRFEGTQKD